MPSSYQLMLAVIAVYACNRAPDTRRVDDAQGATIAATASFTKLPDSSNTHRFHLVSHRFLMTRLSMRGQALRRPLVSETVDETCCNSGERDTWSTFTLEGWKRAEDAGSPPEWSAEIKADEGAIWNRFYKAVLFGCCDETDALTYVSLLTGKVAFVTSRQWENPNADLPHLSVPNSSLERWAGFLDTFSPVAVPEAVQDSNVVGILQYGPADQPASRYVVRSARGRGLHRVTKVEFTVSSADRGHGLEVDLWSANGKEDPSALSGFWITVSLLGGNGEREEPDVILQVPIVDDHVRPDQAHLPSGWSMQAVPSGN